MTELPWAAGDELAPRLRLAVGRIARRLRQHEAGDLSPSQLSALSSIAQHGPVKLGRLAEHEAVSPATLSRVVARLAELGLVVRSTDPDDARSARVAPSARGRELLDTVQRERTAALACALGELPTGDLARLAAALPVLEAIADQLRTPTGAARC